MARADACRTLVTKQHQAVAVGCLTFRLTSCHLCTHCYPRQEAGVLAGRDPESDQLLAFAQGFFMFQTSLLLLQLVSAMFETL